MKKVIKVVGAAILDQEQSKILVAKRDSNRILHDMWEFPGGKIESGETPQEAIKREIKEELNVDIEVGPQVGKSTEFELVAHSTMKWVTKKELSDLIWPAADKEIVAKLKNQKLEGINFE